MNNALVCSILAGMVLFASQCVCRCAEEKPSATGLLLAREDAILVTVTASVEAIDLAKLEVTLKRLLGKLLTERVADASNMTKMY